MEKLKAPVAQEARAARPVQAPVDKLVDPSTARAALAAGLEAAKSAYVPKPRNLRRASMFDLNPIEIEKPKVEVAEPAMAAAVLRAQSPRPAPKPPTKLVTAVQNRLGGRTGAKPQGRGR